ncbi:MAG: DUF2505 domain-containing protein [Rhodococcus sp. (in: high G+C Gram-positive bacteria)]|uniref:DUF2505 domain-containing protein n=1 Tax=Rhodococcus sp. TaxID=1831 RepID=UPI003BB558E5
MSKEFSFSADIDHNVEQVHAALISEEYWKGRLGGSTTGSVEVGSPAGPGTVRATLTDETDTSGLPAVVRGILRGPLVMVRTDEWGPLEGGAAQGTLTGGSSSFPVTIEGRSGLRARDGGAVLEVSGQVTVKVPVVGGQIEGLVVQMVEAIVSGDGAALNEKLSGN